MRVRALMLLAGAMLAGAHAARAEEGLHLLAAGSLTAAMTTMLQESGLPADGIAPPVFGPSGVLRQKIEQGAAADILASADMQQPRTLARERNRPVIMFARNSMCALAREKLGLTRDTMLAKMLDPAVRLATSTPGADPGGDYAWAVFARAEAVHPGAKAALEAKAMTLVGGPDSKPFVPGKGQVQGVFLADKADMMLGYCSGSADVMRDVPGLVSVPLPADLTVGPAYGMIVLTDSPLAARFALFVMSERGQGILAHAGFSPVALPDR
jgi:molybdate transport system substrate-binding protein